MQETIDAAQTLLAQGNFIKDLRLFSDIVHKEPENIIAIARLTGCLLKAEQVEKAKAVTEAAPIKQ